MAGMVGGGRADAGLPSISSYKTTRQEEAKADLCVFFFFLGGEGGESEVRAQGEMM